MIPRHSIARSVALAFASLVLPWPAVAQEPVLREPRLRLGDVDGDGRLDAVTVGRGDVLRIHRNDGGRLTLAPEAAPPLSMRARALVLFDADGDHDLDVAVACSPEQNRLFRNDGNGRFEDATGECLIVDRDASTAVAAGDVDGDGDVDVVWGRSFASDRLDLNTGTGHFAEAPGRLPERRSGTMALLLADVDADGDPDLLCGNRPDRTLRGGDDELLRNEGDGRFTNVSKEWMPNNGTETRDLALADVDGDGLADLIAARGGDDGGRDTLHRQERGRFLRGSKKRLPAEVEHGYAVAAGDLDGDGDVDLVFGHGDASRAYTNDGSGTFGDWTVGAFGGQRLVAHDVALGDLDGDGDLDLVLVADERPLVVLWNDGQARFAPPSAESGTAEEEAPQTEPPAADESAGSPTPPGVVAPERIELTPETLTVAAARALASRFGSHVATVGSVSTEDGKAAMRDAVETALEPLRRGGTVRGDVVLDLVLNDPVRAQPYAMAVHLGNGGHWSAQTGCLRRGSLMGHRVEVIDADGNGGFGDRGTDLVVVDDGAPLPVGGVWVADGGAFELTVDERGTWLAAQPRGDALLPWDVAAGYCGRGELRCLWIENERRQVLQVAGSRDGRVPVGSYRVVHGEIAVDDVTVAFSGRAMEPLRAEAAAAPPRWGRSAVITFEWRHDGSRLQVHDVALVGELGEVYEPVGTMRIELVTGRGAETRVLREVESGDGSIALAPGEAAAPDLRPRVRLESPLFGTLTSSR